MIVVLGFVVVVTILLALCTDTQAYSTPAYEECFPLAALEITDVETQAIRIITRGWRSKGQADAILLRQNAVVGFAHFPVGDRDPFELGRRAAEFDDWSLHAERWGYSEDGVRHQLDVWRRRMAPTVALARTAGCRRSCLAKVLAYANHGPREVERIAAEVGWDAYRIGWRWYQSHPTGHRWRRLAYAQGYNLRDQP